LALSTFIFKISTTLIIHCRAFCFFTVSDDFMNYSRTLLFGSWYRNDTDDQGLQVTEFSQLKADGSFVFTFLSFDNKGEVKEKTVEIGDWGMVGDIHFTMTKKDIVQQKEYEADLTNSENYQAYRVIDLNYHISLSACYKW